MRRVLFDSDVVSSWHDRDPAWEAGITAALTELGRHGAEVGHFISSVSIQELLFHAHTQGRDRDTDDWLGRVFTPLSFDREAARCAARVQAALGRPLKTAPKSADRLNVNTWFRDCAILGTAIRHKIDVVVTADEPFYQRRAQFPRSMMLIRLGGVYRWEGYVDPD